MSKPAFPTIKRAQYHNVSTTDDEGMTLRDYFAAKAMQAQLARTTWGVGDDARDMAQEAYMYADAMMKAREQ